MLTATTAYLVAVGGFEDYGPIAVLAVKAEAQAFADDYNLRNQSRHWERAVVEPVEFYAAGWRPAPREVLDGDVVQPHCPELIP